jgi:cytoskeletal protein CcmA (bactofilin family)
MTQSIIATGLQIVGNIKSQSDVLIEGSVEGNLEARNLTIAQGATVEGSVMARTAHINGTLIGDVGAGSVVISKTAEVSGAVLYGDLTVEPGARLEIHCQNQKGRVPISDAIPSGSTASAAVGSDTAEKKDGS